MDLVSAALHVCSEDDALVSNSPVEFPVESFVRRIDSMVGSIERRLREMETEDPSKICDFVDEVLFGEMRFRITDFGESNLPHRSLVDHPGVWENQKYAYMHELLISRTGIPALMSILYQHVMKQLLIAGSIDFVVAIDHGEFSRRPRGIPIGGLSRSTAIGSDGSVLNMCSSDVLGEVLVYLKRSFWPFTWDTNDLYHGGFREGCNTLLFGEESAEHEVISRVAKHRLDRGIWTTTGGGDILRAIAACERLVLLYEDRHYLHRRDLALLYFASGDIDRAAAEMDYFLNLADSDLQSIPDRHLCKALRSRLPSSYPSYRSEMKLSHAVLLTVLVTALYVHAEEDENIPTSRETKTDPCSCALLNFWDIKPREDATKCCEALNELCYQSNSTLHCGHVYRFCLKRRAGFSAYILDEFVRTELRYLDCEAYHPLATHENEKCGGGYCRIGYTCATVKVQKCYSDGGIVCGDGYCNNGAECAEMSSQSCMKFKEKNLEKKDLTDYDEPKCKDGVCQTCKTITEHKCAFHNGITDPCKKKGCAAGRTCIDVEEEVCVVRPDAALYINGETTHAPEKVKKKFRRFTAFVLPFIAAAVSVISVIAFISWATIRVRKARKEISFNDDSDNESPHEGDNGKGDEYEKDMPVTPIAKRTTLAQNATNLAHSVAEILSPRLRLSVGRSPIDEEENTPLSNSHTPTRSPGGRFFSPHRYEAIDRSDARQ